MENTLTSMVYFASPAARKTFGSAKLSGQMSMAQMEKVCKSCTVIANASPDNEKQPTSGRTRINNVMSVKHIPPYASPNSFLLYRFACSFSPAPMQRPITVTIASPIAIPGILANPAILFATAFAAIAAVPNVAVRLDTRSLPI